jgi:hypothetical protein
MKPVLPQKMVVNFMSTSSGTLLLVANLPVKCLTRSDDEHLLPLNSEELKML